MILFLGTRFSFAQKPTENQESFIKVYSVQSYLRPPFETKEIECSNKQICYRIVLPKNPKRDSVQLQKHIYLDTTINCQPIKNPDYDSIVNYILTSGLLNIDLNYTKLITTNGVVAMHSGSGAYRYIIKTSNEQLDLPISGAADFTVPVILRDFDHLFRRISSRYVGGNE